MLLEQWQAGEIVDRLDVLRPESCSGHGLAVVRHVDVCVLQQTLELRKLDFLQLGSGEPLALSQVEIEVSRTAPDQPLVCGHRQEVELEQRAAPTGVGMTTGRSPKHLGRNARVTAGPNAHAKLHERRCEVAERLPDDSPDACIDERPARVTALEEGLDLEDRIALRL